MSEPEGAKGIVRRIKDVVGDRPLYVSIDIDGSSHNIPTILCSFNNGKGGKGDFFFSFARVLQFSTLPSPPRPEHPKSVFPLPPTPPSLPSSFFFSLMLKLTNSPW